MNVIFLDMGGVLVRETGTFQITDLQEHSGKSFEVCEKVRTKYWKQLKIGAISDEEYWLGAKLKGYEQGVLKELNIAKEQYENLRQNAIAAITPLEGAQEFLEALHKKYTLVLLSNNSHDWGEVLLEKYDFKKYFTHLVFSHKVGCAKPGKEIFDIALSLVPDAESVVFVDDKKSNTEAAEAYGIPSIVFESFNQLFEELAKRRRPRYSLSGGDNF